MTDTRECEALRILRAILEGGPEELPAAMARGRQLLRTMRGPRTGRLLRAVTPAQLREIARRRADRETEHAIAAALGLNRGIVHHHLRPSQAMQDALLEGMRP
jgi:DNA invertase Pin-like site-specific DNA recombinase